MVAEPLPEPAPLDYYYVLNVPPHATVAEVERAYWRLVRSEGSSEFGMEELNEAYRVLTSPKLRPQYDELRSATLGVDAQPHAPARDDSRGRPPLRVMERQRPEPRPAEPPPRVSWWGWLTRPMRRLPMFRGR